MLRLFLSIPRFLWLTCAFFAACLPFTLPCYADHSFAATPTLQVDATSAQPPLRLCDIAPNFSISTVDGKTWRSHDWLGSSAILVLLLPVDSTDTVGASSELLGALAENVDALRAASVEPIVLFSGRSEGDGQKVHLPDIRKELQQLAASRQGEVVRSLFGVEGKQPLLLFIDKAGFWRRVEDPTSQTKLTTLLKQTAQWQPQVEVGQLAPDFSFRLTHGRIFRLSDLRGQKNLLLTFFPKCFTGGCTNHLTSLRDQQALFDENETQIIAVSVDPVEGSSGQKSFAARWNFEFPLAPDVNRNLSLLYGAVHSPNQLAARMSVLIDKKGVIRWITREVNVQTHGVDVLAVLKERAIGK